MLRNVLPFGTAALHKNDEQKKWLLKECDGDDDVLFVYMKIPANAGQSGNTSAYASTSNRIVSLEKSS